MRKHTLHIEATYTEKGFRTKVSIDGSALAMFACAAAAVGAAIKAAETCPCDVCNKLLFPLRVAAAAFEQPDGGVGIKSMAFPHVS